MTRWAALASLLAGCTAIAPFGGLTTGDAATDASLDAGAGGPKLVFLSSERYFGNLSGIAGADARCSALANARGYSGRFLAWLSAGGMGPADRFDRSAGPYVRVDDAVVAESWDDLTDGVLTHLIDVDETGAQVADGSAAWTGTDYRGLPTLDGATCEDWTSSTFEARGAIGAFDQRMFGEWSHWDDVGPFPCQNGFRLYCFEQ
ncbi:MAG: hypothetical protein KF729_21975 [Sandaracinaceae bacterium]|nr:hypothetical protein [Sandaracinaceae bacterium]